MEYHKPVLVHRCIELLQVKPTGVYVDATFGGGGHSREILKRLTPESRGHLYAFDQDPAAAANAPQSPQFTLIAANFRYLQKMLRLHGVRQIDGLLADFGVSSHQIDIPERGFSLRHEGPLDMRMNPEKPVTAAQVLNEYSAEDLIRLLREYGELPRPRPIVRAIVNTRPLHTTADLKAALEPLAPRHKPARFWAQVFQAVRIEVNEEIAALGELLEQATALLRPGGRIVSLAYHSLEDRPVKNYFRYGNLHGEPVKDDFGRLIRPLKPVTRKPETADVQEIEENPRARSAKLRAAEKLNENHE